MYSLNSQLDVYSELSSLSDLLRNFQEPVNMVLHQFNEKEIINPFKTDFRSPFFEKHVTINEELWIMLGVRRVTFNESPQIPKLNLPGNSIAENKLKDLRRWKQIKEQIVPEDLGKMLSACSILEFADWSMKNNFSDLWEGFLYDVIKISGKRNFQFIFHLGDISDKTVFEVDEILDIMGEYSSFGKVTLMMTQPEAENLWCVVNGQNHDRYKSDVLLQRSKQKYLSLFNTMRINVLMILKKDLALILSEICQFEVIKKSFGDYRESGAGRTSFSLGYQMGLMLEQKITSCTTFGIAICEMMNQAPIMVDSKILFDFIGEWSNQLNSRQELLVNE